MMNRLVILIVILLIIPFAFPQTESPDSLPYLKKYLAADKIFHAAEKLSYRSDYDDKTEELENNMNLQSLKNFREILPAIEKAGDDSLLFHCYYKIGVLEHYFTNIQTAQKFYLKAIDLKNKLPYLADSLLFKPYLYTGIIFYSQELLDSALNYYKKADQAASQYKNPLHESQRLYNTMGVLYYETANYRQAKNYFEKALSSLTPDVPYARELAVNYKNNLASVLLKLELYDQADSIYQSLLSTNFNKNELLHNIGSINLNLGAFPKALYNFKKVVYQDKNIVRLLNDMGQAFSGIKEYDSAKQYFRLALDENYKWNGNRNNIPHGQTFKYLGDLSVAEKNTEKAMEYYQQAIIQFGNGFNDRNKFSNPSAFSGVFSYINLFHALTAKADLFENLYRAKNEIRNLVAALETFQSAFILADYVEQTYDSDEARMFLTKIKYTAHDQPIRIGIDLFRITGEEKFLEQAYEFDQKNKASILSLNVNEIEIRKAVGSLKDIFREEAAAKSYITRLTNKASLLSDSIELEQINATIRDQEILLAKTHRKMLENPEYRQKKSLNKIPSVKEIRQQLDNTSAILSYHLSENEMTTFIISREAFDYVKIPVNDTFYKNIDSLKFKLHQVQQGQRFSGNPIAGWLFQKLIAPVLKKIPRIDRLIIIPDDELHYLPFEILMEENNNYLLDKFSVQYNFSTSLLFIGKRSGKSNETLAFAPFYKKEVENSIGVGFGVLPNSGKEIQGLKGKIFLGSAATKSNFLQTAGNYNIIHLATHARINNEDPKQSFIAFSPIAAKSSIDYLLYADEIYNLNLETANLVILSACETGTGKLVKGEGLMSLSRAFSYAGCSNIITSLWKAEDQATSFLSQRLHHYLNKKIGKDKALRLAKLDLLNNNSIDPGLKSPSHWSHLIFIGEYIPEKSGKNWIWLVAFIILIGTFFLLYRMNKLRQKT